MFEDWEKVQVIWAEIKEELYPRPSWHEDFSVATVEETLGRAGFYSLKARHYSRRETSLSSVCGSLERNCLGGGTGKCEH